MKTTKSTTPQRSRKASAKPVRKRGTPGPTGLLTKEETDYLIMLALEAINYQIACGMVSQDANFDAWRRAAVEQETGLGGISKINRSHVRDVAARFLELAGRDDEALAKRLKTGPKNDRPAEASDTWESCETYVAQMRKALADHAKFPADSLVGSKGHIYSSWIVSAARQRTRKPTLTFETFAERLDPQTLEGLRNHLISHINLREGRAIPERRTSRVYPPKPDPGTMHEDDPGDPF